MDTHIDTGIGNGLHARFLRGLASSGDRVAVDMGKCRLTYRQLHEVALLWAGSLARIGATTVGVVAGKNVTAYAGILSALYAGATVVPLRPSVLAARAGQALDVAGVDALVVDEVGLALLPGLLQDRPIAVLAPECGPSRFTVTPRPEHALAAPYGVRTDDTACVLFTPGPTGRQRGVRISHGATRHCFDLLDERYDFGPEDVFSQAFEFDADNALFDLFCAWGAGGTAVVPPATAYRDLPVFIAEHGLTVWSSTPSAIGLARELGGLGRGSIPGLRWSFFTGAPLTVADAADWRAAAPVATVENRYGPTELTVTIAGYRWSDELTPRTAVNGVVPIGTVHDGHEYLLLGDGGLVAEREGELCVAGPQVSPGYLDPADDDPARFLHRDGRRWYRTGDRMRRIDGDDLAYLGRRTEPEDRLVTAAA